MPCTSQRESEGSSTASSARSPPPLCLSLQPLLRWDQALWRWLAGSIADAGRFGLYSRTAAGEGARSPAAIPVPTSLPRLLRRRKDVLFLELKSNAVRVHQWLVL